MGWVKKIFHECVACVCLTFGTICSVIAFCMAIGFLMGVMTISFTLPIDLYKICLEFRKGLLFKDFFQKKNNLLV